MKLRTAFVAFLLAVLAVPASQAQDRGPGGGGERRIQMMFKGITLTPVQKTSVDSIIAEYRRQAGPMTPDARPDSTARANRRAMMQKQNADIRALLTREQQPIFDRNLEEMRSMMQRRQGGR